VIAELETACADLAISKAEWRMTVLMCDIGERLFSRGEPSTHGKKPAPLLSDWLMRWIDEVVREFAVPQAAHSCRRRAVIQMLVS